MTVRVLFKQTKTRLVHYHYGRADRGEVRRLLSHENARYRLFEVVVFVCLLYVLACLECLILHQAKDVHLVGSHE